jgi:hypothetical protein
MIADGCSSWGRASCSTPAAGPGDQVSLIRSSGCECAIPGQAIDDCSCSASVQFSVLVPAFFERILA